MSIEVKIPELPESVADAMLVSWHKQIGDYVSEGENLIDLETDKIVLETPAPASGVLKEILQQDGATVTSGDVIAIMDITEKPALQQSIQEEKKQVAESSKADTLAVNTIEHPTDSMNKFASPAARKLVADANVNMSDISGSGRGGRVTKQDVQQFIAKGGSRFEERLPMTRIRKRIAEHLVEVQHTAAILTTFNEVNMQPVMDLRKKYQDQFVAKNGIKLGFMSFFVKASIAALKEFPSVNASIDGDDLIYHNYFDIGIAVSGPRGLVVPILRNSENKSFADIEMEIRDFSNKAKDGSLSIDDMTGGTFTITNGGTFGSMLSTPIINPPQSAILGMHNIVERAVVENSQIVARPVMYLALSYDHRIIDGREAVGFLVTIKNVLEDPARLLLNI